MTLHLLLSKVEFSFLYPLSLELAMLLALASVTVANIMKGSKKCFRWEELSYVTLGHPTTTTMLKSLGQLSYFLRPCQ